MEGDTGFKGIKLFCDLQKVQDAVPKIHISQHQEGRLSLFNRPHRGVSAYSHPSSVSQVPQVLLRAPALPLQGPTIRPVLSPKSLHEDFSSHSSLPQAEAGVHAMLPGRYPSPVQLFSGSKTGCSNYDTHSAESRVLRELQEEPHHSNKEITTSGSDNRLVPLQGISFSGEADQHQETCSSGSQGQESASGTAVKAPRKDDLLYGHCAVGQAPLQTPTMVSSSLPKAKSQCFQQEGHSSTPHIAIPFLVDNICDDQGSHIQGTEPGHPHNRRESVRLGSSPGHPPDPETVVPLGSRPKHQLARTSGHSPGTPSILFPSQGEACPRQDRQRGGQSTRQQRRRDQVLGPDARGIDPGHLGRVKPGLHKGRTHIGGGKSTGRLPEQSQVRPCGVATGSGSVSGDHVEVWPTPPGSICHPDKCTDSQISDTRSGGNGCPSLSVAGATIVRLPTSPPDSGDHTQVDPGRSRGNLDCSTLATASVVCRPGGSFGISSVEDSSGLSGSQPGQPFASRSVLAPTSRLTFERESLARQSYSSEVISLIQASRCPSTNRIYDATWRGFCKWCLVHALDPLSVSIPNILDYLLEGLNKGLSPNTIRRQLAALSSILSCDNSSPLSKHPAVSAFSQISGTYSSQLLS
ncbi:uncharacterized protein LOC120313687 isoform X1 [Crotalus tigris]|uniref:uncharacterized protein LOC120313687 isoform X1 n=1 Tax=Crotalus tigris TaxID=88082 RepID=UPI00192FABBD|nr:uncharacterized protein LOC120313687 isoform X1 [Crotalus tigris]